MHYCPGLRSGVRTTANYKSLDYFPDKNITDRTTGGQVNSSGSEEAAGRQPGRQPTWKG